MRRRSLLTALAALAGAGALGAGCSRADARGADEPAEEVPAARVVVRDIAFEPAEVEVPVGTTVEWVFDDGGILHHVEGNGFDSGIVSGGTFRHTFGQTGENPYLCSVHPHMTGVVRVVERG